MKNAKGLREEVYSRPGKAVKQESGPAAAQNQDGDSI